MDHFFGNEYLGREYKPSSYFSSAYEIPENCMSPIEKKIENTSLEKTVSTIIAIASLIFAATIFVLSHGIVHHPLLASLGILSAGSAVGFGINAFMAAEREKRLMETADYNGVL